MIHLEFYLKNYKNKKKVQIAFKQIKGADHFYENYKEDFILSINNYIKERLSEKK